MSYGVVIILFFFSVSGAHANDSMTPYGDYSQLCSAYGICKENLEPKQAEKAIEVYFAIRGLKTSNVNHKGRFVEAEVYRNGRMVDKVLLDRKTGRIRSTY